MVEREDDEAVGGEEDFVLGEGALDYVLGEVEGGRGEGGGEPGGAVPGLVWGKGGAGEGGTNPMLNFRAVFSMVMERTRSSRGLSVPRWTKRAPKSSEWRPRPETVLPVSVADMDEATVTGVGGSDS